MRVANRHEAKARSSFHTGDRTCDQQQLPPERRQTAATHPVREWWKFRFACARLACDESGENHASDSNGR